MGNGHTIKLWCCIISLVYQTSLCLSCFVWHKNSAIKILITFCFSNSVFVEASRKWVSVLVFKDMHSALSAAFMTMLRHCRYLAECYALFVPFFYFSPGMYLGVGVSIIYHGCFFRCREIPVFNIIFRRHDDMLNIKYIMMISRNMNIRNFYNIVLVVTADHIMYYLMAW